LFGEFFDPVTELHPHFRNPLSVKLLRSLIKSVIGEQASQFLYLRGRDW